MKIYFAIFDKVEELDLVGPWEFIGLLAEMKLCDPPKLISLNSMTPSGEHGMRFSADLHFTESVFPDVLIVPGGSGARLAMKDLNVIQYLQQANVKCHSILSICTGMYLIQKAGLFTHKKATTHWAFLDELKKDKTIDAPKSEKENVPKFVKKGIRDFSEYFGHKVAIKVGKNGKGNISIPFHSEEDFSRIKKLLKSGK